MVKEGSGKGLPQKHDLEIKREQARREYSAAMAEHAYLHVSPAIRLGELPSSQLRAWRADIAGGQFSPMREYHLAWLDAETGHSLFYELNEGVYPREPREEIIEYFTRARERFNNLAGNKSAPLLLRLQARLAGAGMPIYQDVFGVGDDETLASKRTKYVEDQDRVIQDAVSNIKGKTQEEDKFMQTLTALAIFNETKYFAMPTASRFSYGKVDHQHNSDLFMVDLPEGNAFNARVGTDGASDMYSIDPEDLLQDGYPAKHGYGTLQTIIEIERQIALSKKIIEVHEQYGNRSSQYTTALKQYDVLEEGQSVRGEHVIAVRDRLVVSLDRQLNAIPEYSLSDRMPQTAGEALEWYKGLSSYHQFEIRLPQLITAVQLLNEADKRDELTEREIQTLASMYVEIGMKVKENVYFGEAQKLLDKIIPLFDEDGKKSEYYAASIERAALPVYSAVAAGDETVIRDAVSKYCQTLGTLGQSIANDYMTARETNPAAAEELKPLIDDMVVRLLLTTDKTRSYIAVPGTARQSRSDGWRTTVWELTADTVWERSEYDFRPDHFKRVAGIELPEGHSLLSDLSSQIEKPTGEGEVFVARDLRINEGRKTVKFIVDSIEN